MNIAIRLFLGYFLIVGIAAWFLVSIFSREVEPGVRQATEETLVDTANLLAELAAEELKSGRIDRGRFHESVKRALERSPNALISGVSKNSVDARIYVTDSNGVVAFDSTGEAIGANFSQWRDVARVLRGEYGARSTRDREDDPQSSVMYVAAPVLWQGTLIGVLTVSKPVAALMPYAERARSRLMKAGFVLLAISAAIGAAFTFWLTWSLNRLRDYALAVAEGKKAVPPVTGGRQLSVLAKSLALMREKLDGKHYVESYVQSLAHELKSPLTAVRGSAELLRESPSAGDRQRFTDHIAEQAERMQLIIERLLALARVEQLQIPQDRRQVKLDELVNDMIGSRREELANRKLTVRFAGAGATPVHGDPFLLQQAVGNLLDNAIEFSPVGGEIVVCVEAMPDGLAVTVRDHGPGAPQYALPHVFERFYSLPRPATGRKSTGLGLPFVQEVAKLHGGAASFSNHPDGGAVARFELPA